ncbi:EAL domain-containing protein [Oceanospirillum sediminis]|uniref:cyclic-guanylate-specific phosphodiesterase n=1 Tax=Oceanospirillum sediminis TaxID=2760088 RepID=A0A839ITZ6_9GAMM|nr:EAL domain-containing protein [Oceanospirillum sediminis]MBB1488815.1 EAL domain-containing protein [Oceanospirillum sediminis]
MNNRDTNRVLIVDDDPLFLMMLEQFLVNQGYAVFKADSGVQAVSIFKEYLPDAVLLDGDLPDISGVEVCQQIKQLPEGHHIPVIMVTAMNDESFIDQSFHSGSSDYITKPIHWAVLKNRLSYLLQVKETTSALQISEARKSAILNSTADGIITVSPLGKVIDINPSARQIFDLPEDDTDLLLHRYLPSFQELLAILPGSNNISRTKAIRFNRKNPEGELFPIEVSCSRIMHSSQELYSLTVRDISDRIAHEEAMKLASSVFNNTSEAIVITDDKNVIRSVNPAFCKITGFAEEEVIGESPALLSSGRHAKEFYDQMWKQLQTEGSWQGEIWNRRKSGELYPEWLSINTVRNSETNDVLRYIGLFSDITQRKKYEEDIWYQANYDALTDLPNRTLFSAKLKEAIVRQKQEGRPFALMFIDLDRFKEVNDTLGHSYGDLLLLEAARRLQKIAGPENLVARLGGDEFTALIDQKYTVQQLEKIAERIVSELRKPFVLNGQELSYISGSIGITFCPGDATDMETLLKHADMAMYRAKEAGRNTYRFYTEEMNSHALHRIRLEEELRYAIEHKEFILFYQPKLDLTSNDIHSVEALIRWQHRTKGLIPPIEFIPFAEETGLINEIGEQILDIACKQLQQWQQKSSPVEKIALNISSCQLDKPEQFFSGLEDRLNRYGLRRDQIKLEITEHLLMGKDDNVIAQLHHQRQSGLSVAIDDFGTGYSSLSYLQVFPLDELKIDQSFIRNLSENSKNKTLVQAIITMGHALNMSVIAEGVENQEQMDFLIDNGCDQAQGYLLSKPLPAEALDNWLADNFCRN